MIKLKDKLMRNMKIKKMIKMRGLDGKANRF